MKTTDLSPAKCNQCGKLLDESAHISVEERKPCPECGSLARQFEVSISASIETHSMLGVGHKRPGVAGFLSKQKVGDSFSTRLQRWMRLRRMIDREHDRYTETVIDPKTGETIHHCDEPLSEHQGHGSAKFSKQKR